MFRSGVFGHPVDGFGRAIARWNRIAIKMIMSWEIFASRGPRARNAHWGAYVVKIHIFAHCGRADHAKRKFPMT